MMRPARSLKSRALQLVAQREQSRVELRRKLLMHAVADDELRRQAEGESGPPYHRGSGSEGVSAAGSGAGSVRLPGVIDSVEEPVSAEHRVEAVLVWLEANGFSSDERFAESRVDARAARHGERRIRQELKQHGVTLSAEAAQTLRETEGLRARSVWQRRFGMPAKSAGEVAKQSRFLLARGFSSEVVRRLVRRPHGADEAAADAGDDHDDDALIVTARAADD